LKEKKCRQRHDDIKKETDILISHLGPRAGTWKNHVPMHETRISEDDHIFAVLENDSKP